MILLMKFDKQMKFDMFLEWIP